MATKLAAVKGTIAGAANFHPETAAERLNNAMKKLGTDEDVVIEVTAGHNSKQRQEISVKYKTMYGKDLVDDLRSELSFNFKTVVVGLYTEAVDFDAESCYFAMKGVGTNERTLVDVICTKTNDEIEHLKNRYKILYSSELEKDVASETGGYFNRILVAMLAGGRDESTEVDVTLAKKDADDLYQAGEKKWGTDEMVFNQILCARSRHHLRHVFDHYKTLAGKELVDSIRSETSGDYQMALLAMALSAYNVSAYFAERLYNCMKGLGTNDAELIRICVARCEVDMANIRSEFHRMYGQTLMDFIRDDTSGDYRKILLAIVSGSTGSS